MGYGGKYCFDAEAFAEPAFDLASFLEECRARHPMETIHQDLKQFQTALENQARQPFLVAIINEDYAEFLQLSSKLKGVDEAVSSVRSPILGILKRVDQAQAALSALRSKIQKQTQTNEELEKAAKNLQLNIRISEKMLLLEELLEISSPEGEDDDVIDDRSGNEAQEDEDDDGFDNFEAVKQSAMSKLSAAECCANLERAAQNLVQLELEFFEGMDIPTIQREEKRLAVIEETLLRRLETEFAAEILPDTFYGRDHTISAVTLSYLLRAYVLLQKSHIAEEMIGRLLVQPFSEENLTRGKLDGRTRGSCEGLPQIYASIIEFISSKFTDILALPVSQGESKCSVDILGNAIWKPLQQILTTNHAIIFQAAEPDRFQHNYILSMRFLDDLEAMFCSNDVMKMRFRSHESVVEFKERWNMDVYFQLRYSAFASAVDTSFGQKREEQQADIAQNGLLFESSRVFWKTMQNCWSEKVFLLPLLTKFSKLCLQLLLHYESVWSEPLVNAVAQIMNGAKVNYEQIPLYFLTCDEDIICAGSDFHVLRHQIMAELFPTIIKHVQPFVDNSQAFVSELFKEPLDALRELELKCWSVAVSVVAEECKKVLPALRTVKGQYQMTNKPPPTTHSSYVSSIVSPLEDFLNRWGDQLGTAKHELLQSILNDVCESYSTLSMELLKSAMELEESLKSRKLQRATTANLSSTDSMSDTEKMRMQLQLDLEEIQRQVLVLGFDMKLCTCFQEAMTALSSSQ